MSGRFVRASSYRHVFGEPAKDDASFQDIRPQCNGDGNYVAGSPKYFACSVQGGGGPLVVRDLTKTGRIGATGKLCVHKANVLAFQFHPFIDEMIASAGDDCVAMVTKFPEGGINENISKADVRLEGHQKKISIVNFHPTAMNVLATASFDYTVKLWDIEAQAETHSFDCHPNVVTSYDWNSDGSLALTTCKDKKIRIFDPRTGAETSSIDGFAGGKKASAVWMDNHQKIGAVGFSRSSSREYKIYDPRAFDKPLYEQDIDQSAGTFMITYDPDNSILYLAGKGDSSIKYFEVVSDAPEPIYFLSEFRNSESQKGIGWVPKRALNTSKCEVARALRMLGDKIQPVSFQVPRKSDIFQKDIYPDTYAGTHSMTAAEYAAGENKAPNTQSMDPKLRPGAKEAVTFTKKKSAAELQVELDAALAKIKELEAKLAAK